MLDAVPELDGDLLRKLLPGPFTLVVPNPAGRFPWLTGGGAGPIGDPRPEPAGGDPRDRRRSSASSSPRARTIPGGPNPVTLDDVPRRIRDGCGAELDLGALPGTPSTVLDLTGTEPNVLREGAVPAADALRRLRA